MRAKDVPKHKAARTKRDPPQPTSQPSELAEGP